MVRCARCRTTWRAERVTGGLSRGNDDGEAPPLPDNVRELRPREPLGLVTPAEEFTDVEGEDIPDTDDADTHLPAAEAEPQPPTLRPRRYRSRFGKESPRRAPFSRPRFATMFVVGGLCALAGLGIWRKVVVHYLPESAHLYALVGLPTNVRGLSFSDLKTSEMVDNGTPLLVVSGTIRNVTDHAVDVPRIRVAIRGSGGRELYVWTAMPSRSKAEPGEALPFLARLSSPPPEGQEVAVRFLSARDIAMGPGGQGS